MILLGTPAQASSCDRAAIDRLSVDQAAQEIWNEADVIGFGGVSTVNTPEREQQFVDMVLTLKGPAESRIAYVPLRIGRVGWEGPGTHRIGGQENGPRFIAFARQRDGYIEPLCHVWLFAKDEAGIIRRLIAMARQSR